MRIDRKVLAAADIIMGSTGARRASAYRDALGRSVRRLDPQLDDLPAARAVADAHGLAADRAVLDVALRGHRQVERQLDRLPAMRAGCVERVQQIHGALLIRVAGASPTSSSPARGPVRARSSASSGPGRGCETLLPPTARWPPPATGNRPNAPGGGYPRRSLPVRRCRVPHKARRSDARRRRPMPPARRATAPARSDGSPMHRCGSATAGCGNRHRSRVRSVSPPGPPRAPAGGGGPSGRRPRRGGSRRARDPCATRSWYKRGCRRPAARCPCRERRAPRAGRGHRRWPAPWRWDWAGGRPRGPAAATRRAPPEGSQAAARAAFRSREALCLLSSHHGSRPAGARVGQGALETMNLDDLRMALTAVDAQLLELVAKRQALSEQVASVKRATGRATRDFAREREVIVRGRTQAEALGISPDLAESLLRQLIRSSLATQEQARVAAQGTGSGKRALVIGGHGKMGQWFVEFLASQGFRVTIADPAGAIPGYDHLSEWQE